MNGNWRLRLMSKTVHHPRVIYLLTVLLHSLFRSPDRCPYSYFVRLDRNLEEKKIPSREEDTGITSRHVDIERIEMWEEEMLITE